MIKRTLLFGVGMSATIELLQIFTYRATDVNDLITNLTGTLLGFLLGKILLRYIPSTRRQPDNGINGELAAVCLIESAVMFFLQPFLSALAWEVVLRQHIDFF